MHYYFFQKSLIQDPFSNLEQTINDLIRMLVNSYLDFYPIKYFSISGNITITVNLLLHGFYRAKPI